MRRGGDVVGLPVIVLDSGTLVGRVRSGVFDLGRGRLKGLVVVAGHDKFYLSFEQVLSLGTAAVTIGAEASLLPADGASETSEDEGRVAGNAAVPAGKAGVPRGKRVVTPEGQALGVVDDIIFDAESGAVWGYEITSGFISDFIDGKKAVPLTDELIIGPDAVIVPKSDGLGPVERSGDLDLGPDARPDGGRE